MPLLSRPAQVTAAAAYRTSVRVVRSPRNVKPAQWARPPAASPPPPSVPSRRRRGSRSLSVADAEVWRRTASGHGRHGRHDDGVGGRDAAGAAGAGRGAAGRRQAHHLRQERQRQARARPGAGLLHGDPAARVQGGLQPGRSQGKRAGTGRRGARLRQARRAHQAHHSAS